jgi:chloramphenicol 3-O-phosphotransferase
MQKAVHRVCPACESPTTGAEVDPARRVLLCDLCGAVTPFRLLPPLLFLTGASGAGKTTLYRQLVGRVPEAVLIDADLLWSVNPAHDDPASGYRAFRALILHLAERLAANGRPVLVEGTCTPDQYETLGERWYFSKTAYLAVVCEDETLRRRLAARPGWRRGRQDLEPMLQLNQAFRQQRLDPAPSLLDTTARSVEECAAELHDWIRLQVTDYASTDKPDEPAPPRA